MLNWLYGTAVTALLLPVAGRRHEARGAGSRSTCRRASGPRQCRRHSGVEDATFSAMADEHELADVMSHVLLSIERSGEILSRVTELHAELADLHAELTTAAIDLEAILKRASVEQTSDA
jgi:hypothetical protein